MEKIKLIKLAETDPIQINNKKNFFFSKSLQFLIGANLFVLALIYFTIY